MIKKLYWVLFLYGTIFNNFAADNHINIHETFSQTDVSINTKDESTPFIEIHCTEDCNLENYLKFIIYIFRNTNTEIPKNLKFNLYQNGSLINYMSLGDYIDIYGLSDLNQDVKRIMKNNLNIEKKDYIGF